VKRSSAASIGRLGVIAVVGVTACQTTLQAFRSDRTAAVAACTPPASASTRLGFLRWASGLTFLGDPARGRLHGFQDTAGRVARLELTSRGRSRGHVRRGCIIGRIVSNYADSAFGFTAGTTYIWADSSSPDAVQLVPDDGTSTMTGYEMSIVPMEDGKEPSVAGVPTKHICGECAKNDWCVYPSNGVRIEPAEMPTAAPD
jgi:hypothetical protein